MATVQDINNRENIVEVADEATQGLADQGFVPVAEGTTFNPDNLNSEALTPVPADDFETLTESPPPDISGLDPTPVAPIGEVHQEADVFNAEIQALNEQLLGKSEFTSEQEDIQGVAGIESNITDLSAQLQGLINESKAIPLQLQQESIGRGRTAGGIAPLQASRLRKNAIQALTVNSLLESSRGNLSTALSLVDRAVAQKYDPIKEQIAVKTKNLELIRNSEAYTQDERRQAQAQIDIQNAKLTEANRAEAEQTAIWNLGVEAAKSGLVDSVTLNAIQNAKTKEGALQLMVDAGIYNTVAEGDAFTLSEGQIRYDGSGNVIAGSPKEADELDKLNIEAKKLDIAKKKQDLLDTGDLDTKTVTQVDKVSKSFDDSPIVKNFNEVQNKKLSIDAIVENGVGGPADLALVFEFMKALDPTSVVRESEYEAAAGAGNIFKGWAAKFNGYLKAEGGMLPEEVKQEFKRLSGDKFDIIRGQYNNLKSEKARLINMKTGSVDGNDYLIDYDYTGKPKTFTSLQEWYNTKPDNFDQIQSIAEAEGYDEEETLQIINEMNKRQTSFNTVGSDTNKATLNKVATDNVGEKKGQCGRYVNNITGLGVGDSFNSKMAKMDKSIKEPAPGMVFTMPYKDTGHCGIILSVKDGIALVKDSNWSKDEKIKIHKIPVNKMTGFAIA